MYRSYFINGLIFYDYSLLDHHIDSKARIYCNRFIHLFCFLNREDAKDAKGFLGFFPDRNGRSEKVTCPAGSGELTADKVHF